MSTKFIMKSTLQFSLLAVCMSSCSTTQVEPRSDTVCTHAISIDKDYSQDRIHEELQILSATIMNDEIQIKVQYSGGCEEEMFSLHTAGLFLESNPVQLELILDYENIDACRAVVQEDLCFDLRVLSAHYKDSYQTDNGVIILRLSGYEETINYNF